MDVDLKLELLPPTMHEPPVLYPPPEMAPAPIPAQTPPPAPLLKLRQFPLPYPIPEVVLVTAARGKRSCERNPQAVDEGGGLWAGVGGKSRKCQMSLRVTYRCSLSQHLPHRACQGEKESQ